MSALGDVFHRFVRFMTKKPLLSLDEKLNILNERAKIIVTGSDDDTFRFDFEKGRLPIKQYNLFYNAALSRAQYANAPLSKLIQNIPKADQPRLLFMLRTCREMTTDTSKTTVGKAAKPQIFVFPAIFRAGYNDDFNSTNTTVKQREMFSMYCASVLLHMNKQPSNSQLRDELARKLGEKRPNPFIDAGQRNNFKIPNSQLQVNRIFAFLKEAAGTYKTPNPVTGVEESVEIKVPQGGPAAKKKAIDPYFESFYNRTGADPKVYETFPKFGSLFYMHDLY